MKFIDLIRLSFRNFKTRKMRTLLTIVGIGVGIGAILFLVALGYGLQNALIKRITTSEALLTLDVSVKADSVLSLNKSTIKEIQAMPSIQEISPIVDLPSQIGYAGIIADTTAHFIDDKFFVLAGMKLEKGEALQDSQAPEVIVSSAVLSLLNLSDDNIGSEKVNIIVSLENNGLIQQISLNDFIIKGIIKDDFVSYIYLPIYYLKDYQINEYSGLKVMINDSKNMTSAREAIVSRGFQVAALSDVVEQANKVFRIMQIILAVFGVVSLVVAAIGMFNTMTIALLERTQEIGIMKAIGASNIDVWGLFLVESIIIGFLGGASGVALGFLGGEGFNTLLNLAVQKLGGQAIDLFAYPLWFILTIIIFSALVGLITGLYPAKRAARLDALDALRYK